MASVTRMWAMDAPTFTMDSSLLMVGTLGEITIPVTSFLVQHARGLVLFDTQLDPASYDEDPAEVYGAGLQGVINLRSRSEQRLDRQLKGLGFSVSDITHVIVSHLHFDHCGGARLFPEARFYAGAGEMRHAYWPEPAGAGFFRVEELLPLRDFKWTELDNDHDLFGDGSLTVLHTPGHTPGELSMLVRLPDRNVIITGDAAHLANGFEGLVPMPFSVNTEQSVRSMRKLQRLRAEYDAFVWVSHEPDHYKQMGAPTELR